MHNEHVLEVLHSAFHPVVERCGPLGVLQMQLVNGLQLLLCFLGCGEEQGQQKTDRSAGEWGGSQGVRGGHCPPSSPSQEQWGTRAAPYLQGFPATMGQIAQGVPLVTDLLAPGVDIVRVVVIQLTVGWRTA